MNDLTSVAVKNSGSTLSHNGDLDKRLQNKKKNGVTSYYHHSLGDVQVAFVDGDVIDISSNPASVNTLTYYCSQTETNFNKKSSPVDMRKIHLSGLSIQFDVVGTNNEGDIYSVTIRSNDYDVKNDVRWTGDIQVHEEVNILSDKTVTINQNRTVIQNTKVTSTGEYSEISKLTVLDDAELFINSGSELIIEENAELIIESRGLLEVKDGGKLIVESGGQLKVYGNGQINMNCNSELGIESGISFLLDGSESYLNLLTGSSILSGYQSVYAINVLKLGNGRINEFEDYILLMNDDLDGIYCAEDMTILECTVSSTGDVILIYENEIYFPYDIDMTLGGKLKIIQVSNTCD